MKKQRKKVILNATSDYNSENILFNNVSLDNITSDENHIKGSESKKIAMAKL